MRVGYLGALAAAVALLGATDVPLIDISGPQSGSKEPKESEKPRRAAKPVSREKLIYALGRLLDNSASNHHARQVRDYIDQIEEAHLIEVTALKNQIADANEKLVEVSDALDEYANESRERDFLG